MQGPREFKKSQKNTLIFQNLHFMAFLHYNFQKAVGAWAPTVPIVTGALFECHSSFA